MTSQAEIVVTGWDSPPISEAMLDQAKSLQLIVHAAGSIKHLLPAGVWERNIRVATNNYALGVGVAETTLGMIIAGLKGFIPCNALTHDGGWKSNGTSLPGFSVREVFDVTIGLVGLGQVARHLLGLLKGFEVAVVAYDPVIDPAEADAMGVELVELNELFARSDVVSIHAPALPMTRHMIGNSQLRLLKDDSILINTARGNVIDDSALIEELKRRRIWTFLDVTDPEPPAVDHPFRSMPHVILTPHIAGAISNGIRRIGRNVVRQIGEFVDGSEVNGEVTAERAILMA
ncbi:MAG: hydroxyacid dehydrogenase [Phycisphaerales bacterium]|nr:hydroxyacid dehydrogenase [Phycisphaerales bacterium]